MHNPRIGQLADLLLNLEDAGRTATDEYRIASAEYLRLKALPENWPDVRSKNHTPEQAALAAAWRAEQDTEVKQ